MTLVGLVVVAQAQRAIAEAPVGITLAEVRAAVAGGPAQLADRARGAAARADAAAADPWPAPSLSIATSRVTARLITAATIPLPTPGARGAARAVARAQASAVEAASAVHGLELESAAVQAWLELAGAEAQTVIADDAVASARELTRIAQVRLVAGDVAATDVVTAQARQASDAAAATAAHGEVAIASAMLATALGRADDVELTAVGGVPAVAAVTPLATAASAQAQHPAHALWRAQQAAADAGVAVARASRWPSLAIDVEADWFDPAEARTDVRIGVTIELPLGGRGAARVRSATQARAVVQADAAVEARALSSALIAAQRSWQAASARAQVLDRDVVPLQAAAAAQAMVAYREGNTDLATALVAARDALDGKRDAIDAHVAAAIAAERVASLGGGRP